MIIKVGLIGESLNHSISDVLHNFWLKRLGIYNAIYNKIEISENDLTSNYFEEQLLKGYIGFNVTIPYKEKIIPILNDISNVAFRISAVNTIFLRNGKLIGDNSDYIGVLNSLINVNIKNENVLVIGAGGAAKSVIYALLLLGAYRIYVFNRTFNKSLLLKDIFLSNKIIPIKSYDKINENTIKLIVNATSLGMNNELAFDFTYKDILLDNATFFDVVYNPLETEMLKMAKSYNYNIINGLSMLVYQAEYSFYKWFGVKPDINNDLFIELKKSLKK